MPAPAMAPRPRSPTDICKPRISGALDTRRGDPHLTSPTSDLHETRPCQPSCKHPRESLTTGLAVLPIIAGRRALICAASENGGYLICCFPGTGPESPKAVSRPLILFCRVAFWALTCGCAMVELTLPLPANHRRKEKDFVNWVSSSLPCRLQHPA